MRRAVPTPSPECSTAVAAGERCSRPPLARLAGSTADHHAAAHRAVPALARLWSDTPHSCERAAYLAALVALSTAPPDHLLVEGLWDGEDHVRAFAAARAPLTRETRARLRYLADDPIETTTVRAAARLA